MVKKSTIKSTPETEVKKSTKTVKEPDFKDIKEEITWLKKKRSLSQEQKDRLEFLTRPVKVYTEKPSKKTAKKPVKRAKKPAVRQENGEWIADPTTYTKLKSYITAYCRAMGWKKKNFTFQGIKTLGLKDFKIDGDKETKTVTITGNLMFQTALQMFSKPFKKTFTLDNFKDIKTVIVNTYRYADKTFKGKDTVDGDMLIANGWSCVYDM